MVSHHSKLCRLNHCICVIIRLCLCTSLWASPIYSFPLNCTQGKTRNGRKPQPAVPIYEEMAGLQSGNGKSFCDLDPFREGEYVQPRRENAYSNNPWGPAPTPILEAICTRLSAGAWVQHSSPPFGMSCWGCSHLQSPIHTVPLSFTNWNNSLCLRGTNAFHSWSLQNCKAKVCLCELLMAKNKLFFSFWAMADMRDFILTHRTKVMSLLVTSSHQCWCHTYCIKGTSVLQQNIAYVNIWPPSHGRRSEQSLKEHLLCN